MTVQMVEKVLTETGSQCEIAKTTGLTQIVVAYIQNRRDNGWSIQQIVKQLNAKGRDDII